MRYSELANVYEKLEFTPSKLEKTDIISEFLKETSEDVLERLSMLLTGQVFPEWDELELGVGPSLLYDTISFVTGVKPAEIKNLLAKEGDIGNVTEKILKRKVQHILFKKELTVEQVYTSFGRIARAYGSGSQNKKVKYLAELLSNASPKEAKYIVRTVLGELRIGVAEGLVRDAIAKAFNIDVKIVGRAFMLANHIGIVAKAAKTGKAALEKIKIKVFIPIRPMLAQLAPDIQHVLKELGEAAMEIKYDGARVQIHKKGDEIKIYSRRLENVTEALPDIVKMARKAIKADEVIIDGETVAIDTATGKPRAFQEIMKRFRRKHDIAGMLERIPFETYIFDVMFINGKETIDMNFRERRQVIEEVIKPVKGKFGTAEQIITSDFEEAEKFYHYALDKGHEGIMIKNLKALYIPGARVGYMYKIKPTMETLDLVVIGATWGTGKRSGWLGSYFLGVRDESTGEFLPVGKVATGLSEEQLKELTSSLKPLIEYEEGQKVMLKPMLVVEVAYQEIQRSPNYESGYALRFPRVVRIRDDKSSREADTIDRLISLYNHQATSENREA